jgi:hypothetical protein
MGGDAPDRVVDAVHIDIWTEAGFASDCPIRDEMADDVTGPVLEAWIHLVRVDGPPEDMLVEARGLSSVRGGNAQVGDSRIPEDG